MTITIFRQGGIWLGTYEGRHGGGPRNMPLGDDAENAAAWAINQVIRVGWSNPSGWRIVAPDAVLSLIPSDFRGSP